MDENKFWQMIEEAWRAGGNPKARKRLVKGKLSDEHLEAIEDGLVEFVPALSEALNELSQADLLAFDRILERKLHELDRKDVHEHTEGSEDGFLYMRGFIVAAGRDYYEAVHARPATVTWDRMDFECEELCYLPAHIYEDRFGDLPASEISRESRRNKAGWPDEP